MTLEEYKKKVEELLIQRIGPNLTKIKMDMYQEDFQEFLDENWTVEEVATGISMNLL